MKNVKDQVYKALADTFGEDHVTDTYPKDWAVLPAVEYTEEDNSVYEHTFEGEMPHEDKSRVRYKVDIWHNQSTSAAAIQADTALSALGLKRIACGDVPDPSGLKHKVMRYAAIIDCESDRVYWDE